MTTPAHMAGGYLAAKAMGLNEPIALALAVFFSVLPDIDYFWSKASDDHHHLVHTPFFWFGLGGIFLLISPFFPFLKGVIAPLLAGSISHLLLDFFAAQKSGIKMLFPFSEKEMSFFPLQKNTLPLKKKFSLSWAQAKRYYTSSYILFSETSLLLAGLISLASPSSDQTALL